MQFEINCVSDVKNGAINVAGEAFKVANFPH